MGDSFVDPELDLESALDCIRDTLQAKGMQADAVLFHVSCFPLGFLAEYGAWRERGSDLSFRRSFANGSYRAP